MTLKDSFSADATARAARCMASGSVRKSSAGSSRSASSAERHGGQTYSRHSGSSAPTNSGFGSDTFWGVDELTPQADAEIDRETASALALEILDELAVRLLECRRVLEALHEEVDLNFDDFIADISVVERSAQEAFGAASLLNKGAGLDERWGYNLSRPKAIFARHRAAARRGAPAVSPEPSTVDLFHLSFRPLIRLDRLQDMSGPRPTCAAATRDGSRCESSAIYLGTGVFGPNCYVHSTRAEREQYRQHQEKVAAQIEEESYSYAEQMCAIGHRSMRSHRTGMVRTRGGEDVQRSISV
jgi:hypothetical protein